jgi:hypothetical protein
MVRNGTLGLENPPGKGLASDLPSSTQIEWIFFQQWAQPAKNLQIFALLLSPTVEPNM